MFRSLLFGSVAIVAATSNASAKSKNDAMECRLFELAYKVTQVQKDAAFSDILVDCPGYESWEFEMSTRENSNAYLAAKDATLPAKVQAGGAPAKAIFQRMIARGVPLDVAKALVETRAFDKAVAKYGR